MRRGDIGSVIVFTRTKHRANRLADYLTNEGVPNAKIHGNRSQAQRTEALEGFKIGAVSLPRRHGHRGARHRRRAASSTS